MANNSNTPTFKQKLFAKKYIEYKGNASKAALQVYDTTKKNAKNVGYIELQKPAVKKEISALLNKKGLSLEKLNTHLFKGITDNREYGKPSQAVFADLLKFAYKLHNVIPKDSKEIRKYTIKEEISLKDYKTVSKELQSLTTTSSELIQDIG